MILTHLVMLAFFTGAGATVIEDAPENVNLSTPITINVNISTRILVP